MGDDPETIDRTLAPETLDPETLTITGFLARINLPVRLDVIDGPTPLPGITIRDGTLVADGAQLEHPGDLLHEAGHLAVLPGEERARVVGDADSDPAREMTAIAWSYAAVCHLGLDPAVVFHDGGYRGDSQNLIENFGAGRYFGVPVLQWLGMTADADRAAELGIEPYPHMIRWLA